MKLTSLSASALSLLLIAGAPASAAAVGAPVIGMTSGQSGVILDNSEVGGSATLFDGSTIQTRGYSRIHLNDGTRLDLGADSKVRIFAKRATLEMGTTDVQSASGYEIDTQLLKIRPLEDSSIARIRIEKGNHVFVTALNAPVNVLNREGMLLARVNPGLPLSFLPQAAGAAGAFDGTGCVVQKSGAAILADASGNTVSELRGADVRKAVGNTAHILGSIDPSATPAGGATQVVKVTGLTVTKKGGCSDVAAKLGATTTAAGLVAGVAGASAGAAGAAGGAAAGAAAAGAGAAAGALSTTVVVVASVAAAAGATVGGVAAAGGFTTPSP